MTFWQRWRFRAESRAIRADLDRLAQRLDHTEQRINETEKRITQLATQIASKPNAINRPQENKERTVTNTTH